MIIPILILIVSLFLLIKGADWLVDGASDLAVYLKVPPIYVGLTVVAFGTSLPELIVSLLAIITNKPGISIGNIIGSNIANIGLIIGIAAIVYPLVVKQRTLQYEFPIMVILSFFVLLLGNKNYIFLKDAFYFGKFDSIILIGSFLIFIYYIFQSVKKQGAKQEKNKRSPWKNTLFIITGAITLFLGGKFFVDSASEIARIFGVSEVIIGLTVVSIGTSLPELFTSTVAAFRKQTDIAVGNIVGSNIFNIAWVLGLVSMIKNVSVVPEVIYVDGMVMIAFTLLFLLFAAKFKEIKRSHGILLVLMYASYIFYLVLRA